MRNPGRVLSRREIIREVWQTEYIGDTRTLNVHIRWLRQRIEEDPDAPRLLRTVQGVSYRFRHAVECWWLRRRRRRRGAT